MIQKLIDNHIDKMERGIDSSADISQSNLPFTIRFLYLYTYIYIYILYLCIYICVSYKKTCKYLQINLHLNKIYHKVVCHLLSLLNIYIYK
jgi:hypothetical protein